MQAFAPGPDAAETLVSLGFGTRTRQAKLGRERVAAMRSATPVRSSTPVRSATPVRSSTPVGGTTPSARGTTPVRPMALGVGEVGKKPKSSFQGSSKRPLLSDGPDPKRACLSQIN